METKAYVARRADSELKTDWSERNKDIRRQVALKSAVVARPQSTDKEVLETAAAFENWLNRPL